MSFNIEEYKTEHECDEHWDLRRKFMLAHKDKFPIDRLVCLAQVFINTEILGCRYPEDTMKLVRELSEEVAADYRERKKGKLQRTFVQASDAAETRAKGIQKRSHADLVVSSSSGSGPALSKSAKLSQPIKFAASSETLQTSPPGPWLEEYRCFGQPSAREVSSVTASADVRNMLSDVIVLENTFHDCPASTTLVRSLQLYGISTTDLFNYDTLPNQNNRCWIVINGKKLASKEGATKAEARVAACEHLLQQMKDVCYTIEVKANFVSETTVDTTYSLSGTDKKNDEDVLSSDNVGNKLMRMMGWTGGGLGKNEQGIAQPISVQERINRSGLGHTNVKAELRKVLQNFARGNSENDLAFSSDFSKEERVVIHEFARRFNLRSKSHGTGDYRQLIISRKENPRQLLHRLIESGGSTEKYNVIKPKSHK